MKKKLLLTYIIQALLIVAILFTFYYGQAMRREAMIINERAVWSTYQQGDEVWIQFNMIESEKAAESVKTFERIEAGVDKIIDEHPEYLITYLPPFTYMSFAGKEEIFSVTPLTPKVKQNIELVEGRLPEGTNEIIVEASQVAGEQEIVAYSYRYYEELEEERVVYKIVGRYTSSGDFAVFQTQGGPEVINTLISPELYSSFDRVKNVPANLTIFSRDDKKLISQNQLNTMVEESGITQDVANIYLSNNQMTREAAQFQGSANEVERLTMLFLVVEGIVLLLLELYQFKIQKTSRIISWVNGIDKRTLILREVFRKCLILTVGLSLFLCVITLFPQFSNLLMTQEAKAFYESTYLMESVREERDLLINHYALPLYRERTLLLFAIGSFLWLGGVFTLYNSEKYRAEFMKERQLKGEGKHVENK